jgi:hypothetical protein
MDINTAATFLFSFFAPNSCVAIESLPYIIQSPGTYCVLKDLSSPKGGVAIAISSGDVSVDFQGYKITGSADGQDVGVFASGVSNVQIFNGTLTGFFYGVRMEAVSDVSLTGLALVGNIFRGATVLGSDVAIKETEVSGLTGYSKWPDSHTFGIEVTGPNCDISRNRITDIAPFRAGEAAGISVNHSANGCVVDDNFIAMNRKDDIGRYIGIWIGGASDPDSVSGNVVTNVDYSLSYSKLADLAEGNRIQEGCSNGWGAEVEQIAELRRSNTVIISGHCSDSREYLLSKLSEYPDEAGWQMRYGTFIRQEEGNEAALPIFQKACSLGAVEGCRLAEIYARQIASAVGGTAAETGGRED